MKSFVLCFLFYVICYTDFKMSAETQAAPREQQRPEYLQFSPNHITGLQARLALGGDALNPSMTFDRQITPDMVPDFQDRDLSKVIAAVTKAGSSPARPSGSPSEWATKYGALLNTNDNTRDRNDTLKLFLNAATGIQLGRDNGVSVAQAIHRRYFQTDKAVELNHGTHTKKYHAVDLNLVVEDILKGYTVDNKLNYDRLRDDRLPIMWFLKIFPKGSDEIIWALIDEEAKRRAKPDVFYRDINVEVQVTENGKHRNVRRFEPSALTAYEKKTLERIWDGTDGEVTQTERPHISTIESPSQSFESLIQSINAHIQGLSPVYRDLMTKIIQDQRDLVMAEVNKYATQSIHNAEQILIAGNEDLAYHIILGVTQRAPENPDGWLALAALTDDIAEKKAYLEKVLALAPNHDRANDIKELLKSYEPSISIPSSAQIERQTDTFLSPVESQRLLINERKQQAIIDVLPEIFEELPLRYKRQLMYSDFVSVMAGLKPATQFGMAGETYNERDVNKMRDVLRTIGLEVELTNTTHSEKNNIPFHHVHIYNPALLQEYTSANSDICTPYKQGMTFKDWESNLDPRGYMYGFSQGYPRTAIEDYRDNPNNNDRRRKTERVGNETYWHIRDGEDIVLRHQALEKFIRMLQESPAYQRITSSGDFALAEKVWARSLPEQIRKPGIEKLDELLDNDATYSIKSMMEAIPEIPSTNNPYKIDNVPYMFDIDSVTRQKLLSVAPFFLLHPGSGGRLRIDVNPEMASFVLTLQVDLKDKRYIAAEAITNNDSGVFALCATSAKKPEDQARLFHHVATEIVRTHRMSANLMESWLNNQFIIQDSGSSSLNVFFTYDQQRPEEERLIEFNPGDSQQTIVANTIRKWESIANDLSIKLSSEEPLNILDLRRIEFLAHSIKIDMLMTLIKNQSKS